VGLIGILAGLGLLIWLAFRGWSVLLLAPTVALAGTSSATAGSWIPNEVVADQR
jgi:hypothetical protein